jgi:hypothetical protein
MSDTAGGDKAASEGYPDGNGASLGSGLVPLSSLLGQRVGDSRGQPAGTLVDICIRRENPEAYPAVLGVQIRRDGHDRLVPVAAVAGLGTLPIRLSSFVDLTTAIDRTDLLLVWGELSGRHLVDVNATRVIRADDFFLAAAHGKLHLVGISSRGRSLLGRTRRPRRHGRVKIVDWAAIEPFGTAPDRRLLNRRRARLSRLRPGQIADLLEQLGGSDRQELLEALDPAAAGDALEEMEPAQLRGLLRDLPPDRAAALLANMEADEAADALRDLDRAEQEELLRHMPGETALTLSEVLNYPEVMAGGFMNPKIVTTWRHEIVADVRARLLALEGDWSDLDGVVMLDDENRMMGDLPMATLFLAEPATAVEQLLTGQRFVAVATTALVSEVAQALIESRRSSVVVTDNDGRPVGRVLADDLIDTLVSSKGRVQHRRFFT